VSGVSGVGFAGYGDPMVSSGLITNRDALVETWQPPAAFPAPHAPTDDPNRLERWDSGVRATLIDFDLTSHLHFAVHTESFVANTGAARNNVETASVWEHRLTVNNLGGATLPLAVGSNRIASFVRPSDATFAAQMSLVDAYADLRADRAAEILAQLGPPIAFFGSIVYLHPGRTRFTLELIDAALRFATFVEMRIKHALACWRPVDASPQIQPMILTPGHGSLPSGHSTEAHMLARILWKLRGGTPGNLLDEQLMRQASRVAVNRTIAGVHFPVDSAAGQVLGLTLANYFLCRSGAPGAAAAYNPWRFDGGRYVANDDFDRTLHYNAATSAQTQNAYVDQIALAGGATAPPTSPFLGWLWNKAAAEWP